MTREEAITVLKAFMENPLFSDVHKQAFNIAIHDIKQRHDWDINNLILINKDNYEPLEQESNCSEIPTDSIIDWNNCHTSEQLESIPTTKNDLGVREFEEIVVEYPPEDLCTYPEYKGKPYFGIKYKENEKEIVGYGTYKPEVLSQYLKNYFISTTKNDLAVDAISRADVLKIFDEWFATCDIADKKDSPKAKIKALPSVTLIRPKGHWIPIYQGDEIIDYRCSECEFGNTFGKGTIGMNFCPRCGSYNGSDNREVVEK